MSDPSHSGNRFKPLELDEEGRQHRMEFSGSDPNLSDMVLVVKEKMFYVSKTHLASHSDFFKKMFSDGNPDKTDNMFLASCNAIELQAFLETLHGVKCVTEHNVAGLLRLARDWRVRVVRDRCEEFLMKTDWVRRSKKEAFALAVEFRLIKVAKLVLCLLKTPAQLDAVIPANIADLDKEIQSLILRKSLEVHPSSPLDHFRSLME